MVTWPWLRFIALGVTAALWCTLATAQEAVDLRPQPNAGDVMEVQHRLEVNLDLVLRLVPGRLTHRTVRGEVHERHYRDHWLADPEQGLVVERSITRWQDTVRSGEREAVQPGRLAGTRLRLTAGEKTPMSGQVSPPAWMRPVDPFIRLLPDQPVETGVPWTLEEVPLEPLLGPLATDATGVVVGELLPPDEAGLTRVQLSVTATLYRTLGQDGLRTTVRLDLGGHMTLESQTRRPIRVVLSGRIEARAHQDAADVRMELEGAGPVRLERRYHWP